MKWQAGRSVMRKLTAVSFNLSDDEESKLYEHAMNEKYFSRYVKKLIAQDINGVNSNEVIIEKPVHIEEAPIKRPAKVVKSNDKPDVHAFF